MHGVAADDGSDSIPRSSPPSHIGTKALAGTSLLYKTARWVITHITQGYLIAIYYLIDDYHLE